jgi:long-chain alkane monooxygenase
MKKKMHLNGMVLNSPTPHFTGLWKHPEHQGHLHGDISYWTETAQILEKGKFDCLFIADVYGMYDTYGNSYKTGVAQAAQSPLHDPMFTIPVMAQATKNLGFACTLSTTYTHPYMVARQFSTLDHLTKGRIGWNIVGSYLDSEAKNFGLKKQLSREERYERMEEYLEVTYKLWEKSWEDGSIVKNHEKDIYADPEKVHYINHAGKYFDVPGPHVSDPSIQRTPFLFQAGGSPIGKAFAAKHAEAVYTILPNIKAAKKFSQEMRDAAEKAGRRRDDILIIPRATVIVGATEEEAKKKYNEIKNYISYEGIASILSGQLGIDLSKLDPDQYVEDTETNAMQYMMDIVAKGDEKLTVREVVMRRAMGEDGISLVGTPEQIADEMEKWMVEGDIDGFNIIQVLAPGTFTDFVELVVPELQRRGLFRTEYESTTLRGNMLGTVNHQLSERHPGKKVNIKETSDSL